MRQPITHTALALCLGGAMAFAPMAATAQPAATAQQEALVDHVSTVGDLAAVCDPSWGGVPRLEAIAYCQGFLTAAGQYHTLLYPASGPVRPIFCVPNPGPSIAESGIAFAAWARNNGQYMREPALDGLLRWAQSSFPCPQTAAPARAPRAAR